MKNTPNKSSEIRHTNARPTSQKGQANQNGMAGETDLDNTTDTFWDDTNQPADKTQPTGSTEEE